MTQTELRPTTETPDAAVEGCQCPGGCGSRGRSVSRRTAIGAGVVAGAAFVAACGSSDSATPSTSTTAPSSSSSASSSSPSSSSSSSSATSEASATSATSETSAAETSGSSAGSSAAPAGAQLAALADVPAGGSLVVPNAGAPIVLARNADGTVVAHTAICTHQGCTVNANGAALKCPCHGSGFDAFTGAVTNGPASKPLDEVAVEVSGDAVFLSA